MPDYSHFPKPDQLRQPGEHAEGATFVVRKKTKGVYIPDSLEEAKTNHVYAQTIDPETGKTKMGYVAVPYDPEANQYPKMLYHPDHGKPAPQEAQFLRGAKTPEQVYAAQSQFKDAHAAWEKNKARTIDVESPVREKELLEIGWKHYKDLTHLRVQHTQRQSSEL